MVTDLDKGTDHPEIAEVNSKGKVTGRSKGLATITAKSASNGITVDSYVFVNEAVATNATLPPMETPSSITVPSTTPSPTTQPMPTPNPTTQPSETPTITPATQPIQTPTPTMQPSASTNFQLTDIEGHPSKAEIEQAVEMGIVLGYEDGTFKPDGKVTRAEFASMIIIGLKPEGEGTLLPFKDNNTVGSWALPALQQAYKLDIIHGYSDNTIRPNNNITHSEMATMVINASKLPVSNKTTSFADDAEIPAWAKPYVSTAEETGIIIVGGSPNSKFKPQALTTRAEAAAAIVRMLMRGK